MLMGNYGIEHQYITLLVEKSACALQEECVHCSGHEKKEREEKVGRQPSNSYPGVGVRLQTERKQRIGID